jgi:hypothetical protein
LLAVRSALHLPAASNAALPGESKAILQSRFPLASSSFALDKNKQKYEMK